MKTKLLTVLFAVFSCSFLSYAQVSPFSYESYVSEKSDTLRYRRMVSDYDTVSCYPLVIFLHGSGERGSDNEAQLKWGVMNFATDRVMKNYRPIVIAPQCPEAISWGNYTYGDQLTLQPTATPTMELLIELIKQTITTMPVDPDRVYITGLSMGGFGTFDAISRYPDLFAAAVPVCGGGDVNQVQAFAHMPIWLFHGALDAAVSPILSTKMVAALMEAGANPGFTLYPEAGHFSWVAAYSDPMLMEWLFSQTR